MYICVYKYIFQIKNNIQVLYLSYDGMTDPLGQSQVLPYLQGISNAGYSIHLISFEKEDKFQKNAELIREICLKSNIQWHPLSYTKNPPVLSTLYDLFHLRKKIKELNAEFHFDIVHCRSQLTAMCGRMLQPQAKLIFDMRGFWVDERVEGGIWNISNPLFKWMYNYLKKEEKKLFLNSDAVVSLTKKALPLIKKIQGEKINKEQLIKVIPCCADLDFFNAGNVEENLKIKIRDSFKIKNNDFVLTYLGGIGTWYLADEMLDFFKRLLIKFNTAYFLFITQENPDEIKKIAAAKNINADRLIILEAARKEVPLFLSLANASIFFIKPCFSKQASSPTKQGEIMSMGIPLICNTGIGDTDEIVTDSDAGVVCKSFNDEAYDNAVAELSFETGREQKEKIRKGAVKFYSLEKGIEKYVELYHELLSQE